MMIGARTGAWAKSGMPTAKDYVQDGLVAMWDGIENAGWGVHDPNATVWKDLVGSNDFIYHGSPFVESNNLRFDGYSYCSVNTNLSAECIEIIASFNSDKINNAVFSATGIRKPQLTKTTSGGWGFGYSGVRWPSLLLSPYDNLVHTFVYNNREGNSEEYIDGIFKESYDMKPINCSSLFLARTQNSGVSYNGETSIYCVRIYETQLERKEVAANYAIDKARFNLP